MAEPLVGVAYFAGWWRELPNKWHRAGVDWRPDHPARVPLLGEYNEPATMDAEINAAAEHGVDFFQILWYPQGGRSRLEPHREKLNEGVRCFVESPEAHRLRFCLEPVNHPPFEIATDAEWESCCREWARILEHPSYLRIDDRPVLKIHGFHQMYVDAGQDAATMQRRLEVLRRCVWERGLPDPLIGVGAAARGIPPAELLGGVDYLACYMDVPALPPRPEPYPYETLVDLAIDGARSYDEHAARPFVPYLPAGWDPRPWGDPRPSFELPDRERWTAALRRLRETLAASRQLGLPGRQGIQPAFVIYAWNEFGEGGFIAPTREVGAMKLEALREVFGGPLT